MTSERWIGIDVSKTWLDLCQHGQAEVWRVGNDPDGFQQLVVRFQAAPPTLIVLEASGGYERRVVQALQGAGLAVAVINPTRVRRFAESLGNLAKTDQLDARVIAHFASVVCPSPSPARTSREEYLAACVDRRSQLVGILTGEKNRLATCPAELADGVQEHIDWLAEKIQGLEEQIEACVQEDPQREKRAEIIDSLPGCARQTACSLVAQLPELGYLNQKQIAALAGLAPFNKDSGKKHGQRKIKGGRDDVRCTLFMPTLSAIRYNPVIQAFYQNLIQRGKEKKVAITACMRKLLVILNAMIRKGEMWHFSPA